VTTSSSDAISSTPQLSNAGSIRNPRLRAFAEQLEGLNIHELAAARTLLRARELDKPNNYFNSRRPLNQLLQYVRVAPELFTLESLAAGPILEFGSGTRNSFSVAALLHINGADRVICYEPGSINLAQSGLALTELLLDITKDPKAYNVSGIAHDLMISRATALLTGTGLNARGDIALELAAAPDEIVAAEASFSLILSNHVLEHVDKPEFELHRMHAMTLPGGRHVHRVDFRDHRFFKSGDQKKNQLHFYVDGKLTTCNGLRPTDIEKAIVAAGFSFDNRREARVEMELIPRPSARRFKRYPIDELAITEIDYVLR